MDGVLCDELLQEIIQRLPPSSAPSVSLVSRRWLALLRSSTSSLSLRLPPHHPLPALTSILGHFPSLSSLTLLSDHPAAYTAVSSDAFLLSVAASPSARRLSHLRVLLPGLLSPSTLLLSSPSFSRLAALQISSLLPLSFRWLAALPSLRTLSVLQLPCNAPICNQEFADGNEQEGQDNDPVCALPLESLSLTGIRASDRGASWLWRRCANLRRLCFRACEGTGDDGRAFPCCLGSLRELELRKCRAIALRVLIRVAEHCCALASLLVHDGSSCEALRRVILARGHALRTLDLRLPLDINDEILLAVAANAPGLAALRLQSCCLVTGEGLRSLAQAPAGAAIEELILVNCTVVEREPGLLTFLCQSMRQLRKLDLSNNDMLTDKEVESMLASCGKLVDIRLRCCRGLTNAALFAILKFCGKQLEVFDISGCPAITSVAIEVFLAKTLQLANLYVEESKISEASKAWVSLRAIVIA